MLIGCLLIFESIIQSVFIRLFIYNIPLLYNRNVNMHVDHDEIMPWQSMNIECVEMTYSDLSTDISKWKTSFSSVHCIFLSMVNTCLCWLVCDTSEIRVNDFISLVLNKSIIVTKSQM